MPAPKRQHSTKKASDEPTPDPAMLEKARIDNATILSRDIPETILPGFEQLQTLKDLDYKYRAFRRSMRVGDERLQSFIDANQRDMAELQLQREKIRSQLKHYRENVDKISQNPVKYLRTANEQWLEVFKSFGTTEEDVRKLIDTAAGWPKKMIFFKRELEGLRQAREEIKVKIDQANLSIIDLHAQEQLYKKIVQDNVPSSGRRAGKSSAVGAASTDEEFMMQGFMNPKQHADWATIRKNLQNATQSLQSRTTVLKALDQDLVALMIKERDHQVGALLDNVQADLHKTTKSVDDNLASSEIDRHIKEIADLVNRVRNTYLASKNQLVRALVQNIESIRNMETQLGERDAILVDLADKWPEIMTLDYSRRLAELLPDPKYRIQPFVEEETGVVASNRCRSNTFESTPFQEIMAPLGDPKHTHSRGYLLYRGTGSGKTLSALRVAEVYYSAALADTLKFPECQTKVLVLLPKIGLVPSWMKDMKKGNMSTLVPAGFTWQTQDVGRSTVVLYLPLNGNPKGFQIVFQAMTARLPPVIAKQWAATHENTLGTTVGDLWERAAEGSLSREYTSHETYKGLPASVARTLEREQQDMRNYLTKEIGDRICIPPHALAIVDEAHNMFNSVNIIQEWRHSAHALAWGLAFKYTQFIKAFPMTATPGNSIPDALKLLNTIKKLDDEQMNEGGWRREPPKRAEFDRVREANRLALECEQREISNLLFAEDGEFKPGMLAEVQRLHTGLFSYVTVQYDRSVFPVVENHCGDKDKSCKLVFNPKTGIIENDDPKNIDELTRDERKAQQMGLWGLMRTVEVDVPMTTDAWKRYLEKVKMDVENMDRGLTKLFASNKCDELDLESASLADKVECIDYSNRNNLSSVQSGFGLRTYNNNLTIGNKTKALYNMVVSYPKKKHFVYSSTVEDRQGRYDMYKMVTPYFMTSHPPPKPVPIKGAIPSAQSTGTGALSPYEFIDHMYIKKFIAQHAKNLTYKEGNQVEVASEKAVADLWYSLHGDVTSRRLIFYGKTGPMSRQEPLEKEYSRQINGAHASSKTFEWSHAHINSILFTLFNDERNNDADHFHVFMGDFGAKEGISLMVTHYVHLLEPSPTTGMQEQSVARVLRYCSFGSVDDTSDWLVTVFTYRNTIPVELVGQVTISEDKSDLPKSLRKKRKGAGRTVADIVAVTNDEYMSRRKKFTETDQFLWALQPASIDCVLFGAYNKTGQCVGTNQPLGPAFKSAEAEVDGYCYIPHPEDTEEVGMVIRADELRAILTKRLGNNVVDSDMPKTFDGMCQRLRGVLATGPEYSLHDAVVLNILDRLDAARQEDERDQEDLQKIIHNSKTEEQVQQTKLEEEEIARRVRSKQGVFRKAIHALYNVVASGSSDTGADSPVVLTDEQKKKIKNTVEQTTNQKRRDESAATMLEILRLPSLNQSVKTEEDVPPVDQLRQLLPEDVKTIRLVLGQKQRMMQLREVERINQDAESQAELEIIKSKLRLRKLKMQALLDKLPDMSYDSARDAESFNLHKIRNKDYFAEFNLPTLRDIAFDEDDLIEQRNRAGREIRAKQEPTDFDDDAVDENESEAEEGAQEDYSDMPTLQEN